MEAIYFVLGVITVLSIGSIVIAIKVIIDQYNLKNKMRDLANDMERSINDVKQELYQVANNLQDDEIKSKEGIYKSIDNLSKNHADIYNDMNKNIDIRIGNVYRDVDSRLDKLENKLTNKK